MTPKPKSRNVRHKKSKDPVYWTQSQVAMPDDWYRDVKNSQFCTPEKSTTDIFWNFVEVAAESRRKSQSEKSDWTAGRASHIEEDGYDSEMCENECDRTVLRPLSEEEGRKLTERKLLLIKQQMEQLQKEAKEAAKREVYITKTKDWLDDRLNDYYRDAEECSAVMQKRLEEQGVLNNVASIESKTALQTLMTERHEKLRQFALSSQNWQDRLKVKQDIVLERLKTYRYWTPWGVTNYYMKQQFDRLSRESLAKKRARLAELEALRADFLTAKAAWRAKHEERLQLLAVAMKKETSKHVIRHVTTRLARNEPLKAHLAAVYEEIQAWQDVRQRWSDLLETKVLRRYPLFVGLRDLDPPGFRLSEIEVPRLDVTTHVLVERHEFVIQELDRLQEDLADQFDHYRILNTLAPPLEENICGARSEYDLDCLLTHI